MCCGTETPLSFQGVATSKALEEKQEVERGKMLTKRVNYFTDISF
jgi:hypothetical protein